MLKCLKPNWIGVLMLAALFAVALTPGSGTSADRDNVLSIKSRDWSIVATYSIPNSASGLAFDGTYLYCGIYGVNGDQVYRIDPSDGSYTLQCSGPQEDAFGLTFDGTYLWTTDHPGSSSTPAIAIQFNMSGGQVSQFNLPDHYMSGIAYDNGDFWVATYYPDPSTIYKVDGSGSVIKQFTAPDNQPWDLCLQDSFLWIADYYGDALYKVDTSTGALIESHASEGSDPAGIVWDGTYLWYCDEGAGGFDYLYKVDLSGSGTPAIHLPITEHDYGTVTVGNTADWNATVENTGTADLEITDVTFAGSSDLSCTSSLPLTIPPAGQAQLALEWAPQAYGALSAVATVHSNDPVHPTTDITLTGFAVNPGPDIHLPETSHNYGTVRINAYTRWLMTIENHGDATLSIVDISSDDGHFIIDKDLELPIDIPVLTSTQIGIWFQPAAAVPYISTLRVSSNDPDEDPVEVPVEGIGLDQPWPIGTSLWEYEITTSYDNSPKAMAPIADINEDGVPDVIICSEDDYVRCFNGNAHATGDVLWEHEIYAGSIYSQNGLQITQDVNEDGYQDVVVGSSWGGRLIRTISGKTGETIWTHDTHEYGGGGWVYQVDCRYDYNSDGVVDVIAATGDDASDTGPKRVYCLNGLTGISLWECPLGGPVFASIGVSDFTGDGTPDAVAGASNEIETEGRVVGINGRTGVEEWTYPVTGSSVWALEEIDDITDDGIDDVIAGDFSMGPGYIYGLDATSGTEVYANSDLGTILRFEKLNDVNGDGHPDIVPAHSNAIVKVIDGQTGQYIWSQPVADKPHCVSRTADISGDGIDDVMIGTLYSDNRCYFLNGVNGAELGSVILGTPVDAITSIPDIVGDGSMEMVVGGRNGYVYCFSGGLDALQNNPPAAPVVTGPAGGLAGKEYAYTFSTTDPEAEDVFYYVEWGDGEIEDWFGPFPSGQETQAGHTWATGGDFSVRAKAKDTYGNEGDWSEPLLVDMSDLCGDVNNDGLGPNIVDVTYLVAYLFGDGDPPPIEDAADMNGGDGTVNIVDLTRLVNWLFGGGPAPDCGV